MAYITHYQDFTIVNTKETDKDRYSITETIRTQSNKKQANRFQDIARNQSETFAKSLRTNRLGLIIYHSNSWSKFRPKKRKRLASSELEYINNILVSNGYRETNTRELHRVTI